MINQINNPAALGVSWNNMVNNHQVSSEALPANLNTLRSQDWKGARERRASLAGHASCKSRLFVHRLFH